VAVITVFLLSRRDAAVGAVPHLANAVKVTGAIGVEDYPSWSPDGRTLAYQSDQSGNWDIWLTQLGSGQSINRTADSDATDLFPSWSPDGQWIAFFSSREGGGYFLMPGVGGTARKVVSWPSDAPNQAPAQWSPDSSQLIYALGQDREPWLEILTVGSGASRKLVIPAKPRSNSVLDIRWSPDGNWLAYMRAVSSAAATAELWLTRISDGKSFQLTDGTKKDWNPAWSADSRELFFLSDRGGPPDLWRYTLGRDGLPEGPPQQLTAGIEMVRLAFSTDGKKLAYRKGRLVRNVFRAPLLKDRPATWTDIKQLTFDEADFESVDVSRDGRLVVSSDRSGNWDLWTLPANGGQLQQLTTDPALDAGPRWNVDGSEIVFYSTRTGHREVWVMPTRGGPARQITKNESESRYPSWSPNGLEIVIDGLRTPVIGARGGETRYLMQEQGSFPEWSPDGKSVTFVSSRDGVQRVWRTAASGGPPERLTHGEALISRWSPDGKQIYFASGPTNNIWTLSLDSREERAVTALNTKRGNIGGAGLATDGSYLYFTWEESLGDIWVADIVPAGAR
jgi:Tol biopolymer transport system component